MVTSYHVIMLDYCSFFWLCIEIFPIFYDGLNYFIKSSICLTVFHTLLDIEQIYRICHTLDVKQSIAIYEYDNNIH